MRGVGGQLRAGRGLLWLRALREDRMATFQEPPICTYTPTDTNTHIQVHKHQCPHSNVPAHKPIFKNTEKHTHTYTSIYSIYTHLSTHSVKHAPISKLLFTAFLPRGPMLPVTSLNSLFYLRSDLHHSSPSLLNCIICLSL